MEPEKFNCYVDYMVSDDVPEIYSKCAIEHPNYGDCIYAEDYAKKEDCPHWKSADKDWR